MPHVLKLVAGPERSMVTTTTGTYALGNIKTVLPQSAGEEVAAICRTDEAQVGHNRFAQEVPQRMSPPGMRWDEVVDAVGVLVARVDGKLFQFTPELVWGEGASLQPVNLPNQHVEKVWAGEQAAYARTRNGNLYVWGDGSHGRLGLGHSASTRTPVLLPGLRGVRQVSGGMGHVLALDEQGRVWSWGANAAGQLGQGNLASLSSPKLVPFADKVVALAAGATHSLALDARGQLWGWGANHVGQLDARWDKPFVSKPTRIATTQHFDALGAGTHFSVALTRTGQVVTWGWNSLGQLGQGDEHAKEGMQRVQLPEAVRSISVGQTHVLALDKSGNSWAWGDNRHGACQGASLTRQRTQSAPHRLALHAIESQQILEKAA